MPPVYCSVGLPAVHGEVLESEANEEKALPFHPNDFETQLADPKEARHFASHEQSGLLQLPRNLQVLLPANDVNFDRLRAAGVSLGVQLQDKPEASLSNAEVLQ